MTWRCCWNADSGWAGLQGPKTLHSEQAPGWWGLHFEDQDHWSLLCLEILCCWPRLHRLMQTRAFWRTCSSLVTPPGRKVTCPGFFGWEGFWILIVLFIYFCLSFFPLLREYFLFDGFSVLIKASLPQRNALSPSLLRIRLSQAERENTWSGRDKKWGRKSSAQLRVLAREKYMQMGILHRGGPFNGLKCLWVSLARTMAGTLLLKVCGLWHSSISILQDSGENWEFQAPPQISWNRVCICTGLQAGGMSERRLVYYLNQFHWSRDTYWDFF